MFDDVTTADNVTLPSHTTILSSLATGSDHVDHVRTQLPYALSIAAVAALVGYLPVGYGVSPWISLGLGALVVTVLVLRLGRRADDPA